MSETCEKHGEPICSIDARGKGECYECLTDRVARKIASHDCKTIARWIVHNAVSPYETWPYSHTAELLSLMDAREPLFEGPDNPIMSQIAKRYDQLSIEDAQSTARERDDQMSFNGTLEGLE